MAGKLDIIVWNVEHGAAIFVRTPNDRTLLLDAGSSDQFSPAEWLHSKYGIRAVDAFILSHADADHISDIELVDRLISPHTFHRNTSAPRELVYPTYPPPTNPLKYYKAFDERYYVPLQAGNPYLLGNRENWGGVVIKTYYLPGDAYSFSTLNNYSLVTCLLYGNLQFLFPGDLEAPGWEELLKRDDFRTMCTPSPTNGAETRILVGAHHGRKAGVHKGFLDLHQPHLSIISDKYGVEHTDYTSYSGASSGLWVWDVGQQKWETRYVLSTKTNDYVHISADPTDVTVAIRS